MAILAVDFCVFPARFMKAQTFGTGLMDLGVGAFVFTGALVQRPPSSSSSTTSKRKASSAMKTILVLLALGLARLASTTAVGYHVNTAEYGVHWNFFFTLAAVRVLSILVQRSYSVVDVFSGEISFLTGVVVLLAHQSVLTETWVGSFVMDDAESLRTPDQPLWVRNKEGIVSAVGYFGLHLAAQGAGWMAREGVAKHTDWRPFSVLVLATALTWVSAHASAQLIEPVSRRSANLPFALWVSAHGLLVMVIASACTSVVDGPAPIWRALSAHQLPVFLLANIITGLVNLTMQTSTVGAFEALLVLTAYVWGLCAFALLLDRRPGGSKHD